MNTSALLFTVLVLGLMAVVGMVEAQCDHYYASELSCHTCCLWEGLIADTFNTASTECTCITNPANDVPGFGWGRR